jgi:hypothetical protein
LYPSVVYIASLPHRPTEKVSSFLDRLIKTLELIPSTLTPLADAIELMSDKAASLPSQLLPVLRDTHAEDEEEEGAATDPSAPLGPEMGTMVASGDMRATLVQIGQAPQTGAAKAEEVALWGKADRSPPKNPVASTASGTQFVNSRFGYHPDEGISALDYFSFAAATHSVNDDVASPAFQFSPVLQNVELESPATDFDEEIGVAGASYEGGMVVSNNLDPTLAQEMSTLRITEGMKGSNIATSLAHAGSGVTPAFSRYGQDGWLTQYAHASPPMTATPSDGSPFYFTDSADESSATTPDTPVDSPPITQATLLRALPQIYLPATTPNAMPPARNSFKRKTGVDAEDTGSAGVGSSGSNTKKQKVGEKCPYCAIRLECSFKPFRISN